MTALTRDGPEPPGGEEVLPAPGPAVELDDAECRRLLGTATVGRITFTDGALPAIVPVPFVLHDGQVLIPAETASAMVTAVRGAIVAFGVDSFDPGTQTGWSVTVVGPSRVLPAPRGVERLPAACLPDRWSGPGRSLVSVQVGRLRGWRRERDPGVLYPSSPPSPR